MNVFLGLGLPWVIAVIYEIYIVDNPIGAYRYPAKGLDLSVLLFLICSLVGLVADQEKLSMIPGLESCSHLLVAHFWMMIQRVVESVIVEEFWILVSLSCQIVSGPF